MKVSAVRSRIGTSLLAIAVGWAAAMLVTLPMQFVKIKVNATGGTGDLLWSLAAGTLVWGAWALIIAAGAWLLGFVPLIVMIPEGWLLGHPRVSVTLAAFLGWIVVLVRFEVWKLLLPYQTLAVRVFTLYSLLLIVLTAVSAIVYLQLIAAKKRLRAPGSRS
jgi:hypothetical protein